MPIAIPQISLSVDKPGFAIAMVAMVIILFIILLMRIKTNNNNDNNLDVSNNSPPVVHESKDILLNAVL